MSNYWFQYDTNTGVIYPYKQDTSPASGASMGVLGPYPVDTATTQTVMAYTYPERFLAQGSPVTLTEQPYLTLTTQNNAGTWTITATINKPPTTAPASATISVNGTETSVPVTNNQAILTVTVHPSISNTPVNVSASATGCASSRTINIGGNTSPVATQVYTPTGGNPTVAPVGTGSKKYLETYYALGGELQSLLADISTAISLIGDVALRKTVPAMRILYNLYNWATNLPTNAYTPTAQDKTDISSVRLDANETTAMNDIAANLIPNFFTTLENAYPDGGARQLQFNHYVADNASTFKNFESYMTDLQNIPNLA